MITAVGEESEGSPRAAGLSLKDEVSAWPEQRISEWTGEFKGTRLRMRDAPAGSVLARTSKAGDEWVGWWTVGTPLDEWAVAAPSVDGCCIAWGSMQLPEAFEGEMQMHGLFDGGNRPVGELGLLEMDSLAWACNWVPEEVPQLPDLSRGRTETWRGHGRVVGVLASSWTELHAWIVDGQGAGVGWTGVRSIGEVQRLEGQRIWGLTKIPGWDWIERMMGEASLGRDL